MRDEQLVRYIPNFGDMLMYFKFCKSQKHPFPTYADAGAYNDTKPKQNAIIDRLRAQLGI